MKQRFMAIYLAGMIAEILLRLPYDRQRRQIPKTEQRVSPTEQALLGGLFVGNLVLPLVYGSTGWLDGADYPLSPPARTRAGWLGAGLLAIAIWLFWRAHRDLGANWSPSLEIRAQHTLVTTGVYGHIRHPMYASHVLWGLAQLLLLPNGVAGWAGLASFLPLYLSRVPHEEQMMADHFGAAYRDYCARTGRIMPRFRG